LSHLTKRCSKPEEDDMRNGWPFNWITARSIWRGN
jgi:hypothetical protein